MKIKDMKQAVLLLSKEWNLGKKESGATNNICAWKYLMKVLEDLKEKYDGEVSMLILDSSLRGKGIGNT